MSTQKALLLIEKQGEFAVRDIPIPSPGPGEVLVKIHAAALNPIDYLQRDIGLFVQSYPAALGWDGAGIVEQAGEGVSTVAKGDKVAFESHYEDPRTAAYQQYAVSPAEIVYKIPSGISFQQAATVPLCVTTAAVALYQKLPLGAGFTAPWEEGGKDKYAGHPILVLAGSSSVGQYAIQLLKLSGFSPIITTASLHNEAHLKSLGATHVIDRKVPLAAAVREITSAPLPVIFDTVSAPETQAAGFELLSTGGHLIIVTEPHIPEEKQVDGKKVTLIFGSGHPPRNREFGKGLYAALTELLEDGSLAPNRVEELPGGFNAIAGGLQRIKENKVSAKKLVVSL